jgi:molybdenum cofactor synthesis domain-containing protein
LLTIPATISLMTSNEFKIAVLTISDRCSFGQMEDRSGPAVESIMRNQWPLADCDRRIVADDEARIASELLELVDHRFSLLLTTGGTGLGPRDVTPEATRRVIEREVPGLAEAMRAGGAEKNHYAWLSRGVAGVRARTLIINLPGSERGATESLAIIMPLLQHALEVIAGGNRHP